MDYKLILGDCLIKLKDIEDNSIDSVVTDPPYGISFMGKKWDYDVPSVEIWKECFRVLKPGGHLLSFSGSRTYHRMAVNIEDAGFEIRDQIQWLYGSGFPKSLNVGKAVDKLEGNEREVVGTLADIHPRYNSPRKGGDKYGDGFGESEMAPPLTKGQSEWEGWGSALKPANEPICLARKPLSEKSIAENVLKWKTGGLNIDGCRIEYVDDNDKKSAVPAGKVSYTNESWGQQAGLEKDLQDKREAHNEGRFPANLILDETAAEMLDEQSGVSKSIKSKRGTACCGNDEGRYNWNNGEINDFDTIRGHNDSCGASRFFYVAKVSKAERNMGLDGFDDKSPDYLPRYSKNEDGDLIRSDGSIVKPVINKNTHPTVKPVNLMSYLCKLITPPNGIVLDPFMGSGSTGIAALLNDFRFVGMEMDNDYFKIAESRINSYEEYRKFLKK